MPAWWRRTTWPAAEAQAIREVHVSQAPPTFAGLAGDRLLKPEVRISAPDQQVDMLGAVLRYGQLVAPLQAAWLRMCTTSPERCRSRFGTPVQALKRVGNQVEIDAGVVETHDLAVIAEGGVFSDQVRKAVARDYGQTAWVGTVLLKGAPPGTAFERFTRQGPVALLPLPRTADLPAGTQRASLVWCVTTADDPVAPLTDAQRRAVLATLLPPEAGTLVEVGPLKSFALGLNAERTLVEGRQVRIGNAAQTLHPVAGQGLNLGLRDAYALVDALRRHPTDIGAALRRVEFSRAPDRWGMIFATDFLARSFTWQWPGLAAARGLGLAALQLARPVKGLLARRMMFGRR